MRIVQVDLENVKSYERASVAFTEGINAICGPNGAGKSTLLEAVGFALFDFLPTTQAQFVREGEKVAAVTVHLADDDGRVYQVVRKCGSYSRYYIYDPEIDQKLVDGKGDTMDWLYEFLGVERTGDLSALFQDAVGVPQGLLAAAFLDKASNRKNTFNALLRVDEYERVWNALRDPRSHLKGRINEQEKRIAGFDAEVRVLPGWQDKATSLRGEIEADEKRRTEAKAELAEVTERKETSEAVKERLDALNRSVTEAEAEVKTLGAQLADARSAVERAEEARAVVKETEPAHQAYLAAQVGLDELEVHRKERDRVKEERQEQAVDLASAQQRVEGLEAKLKDVAAAEEEMETLRPEVEAQGQLEKQLDEARRAAERLSDREQSLEQEQRRLTDLKGRLGELQAGLAERGEVAEETRTLQEELAALGEQRETLTAGLAATRAELDQLAAQTASLEDVEEATCPVCEGPLTPEHREELLARNRAQAENLEAVLSKARSQQREIDKTRETKQEALSEREERINELPRSAEVDDLAAQVEAQQEAVAKVEAEVAGLAEAPAQVERLESGLEALGDPRRNYQRAADAAEQREEVEEDLAAAREHVSALEEQIAALDESLVAYVDLDEQWETQREAREAHEPDHQRYLEHVREAEALEERQGKVASLSETLKDANVERDRLVEERDQIAGEYDADAYAEVVETYTALRDEVATLEERLRQHGGQLEEAQAEIDRLTGVQEELAVARTERAELDDLLTLLEHLRGVLRDAGPKVTQALVEVISLQAARLYAEIMADHTARLRWTEDYEIVLTSGGRERTFQQLSGGEQMAAALSVRLALLREVSSIDVAFFDEPTANLDDHRRDNLAEQILNVKGFSQLFVISHDDTFERDTDNVIRLVKEDGVSRAAVYVGL